MNYLVCVGCLAAFGVSITGAKKVCNKETIEPAWIKCDKTYFVTGVKDEASMKKMCRSVEGLIRCKKDAVGDCVKHADFRKHLYTYDPERWGVYFRYSCSNLPLAESQFSGDCVARNVCRPDSMAKKFNPALKDKQALCSMFQNTRKCVSMNPGGRCTAAVAKFHEDIRKLGYSVSICDNTDIKDLYTIYGGRRGNNSGTTRTMLSLPVISSAIFCWILYQFRRWIY